MPPPPTMGKAGRYHVWGYQGVCMGLMAQRGGEFCWLWRPWMAIFEVPTYPHMWCDIGVYQGSLQPNYAPGRKRFVDFGDPNFKVCTHLGGGGYPNSLHYTSWLSFCDLEVMHHADRVDGRNRCFSGTGVPVSAEVVIHGWHGSTHYFTYQGACLSDIWGTTQSWKVPWLLRWACYWRKGTETKTNSELLPLSVQVHDDAAIPRALMTCICGYTAPERGGRENQQDEHCHLHTWQTPPAHGWDCNVHSRQFTNLRYGGENDPQIRNQIILHLDDWWSNC